MRTFISQLPAVSIEETLAFKQGIVDLWYYFYEGIEDADLLAAQEALMTSDERTRLERFHFERDRRLFLATRALVRTVLSRYSAVLAPVDWRFDTGAHGKPHIASPVVSPTIHFNLANTPGLVVCAVSVAHELIGVDVEQIDRTVEILGVAERYFSPLELLALQALPASEQSRRFFTYWTLKESYIKARGLGLAIPLDLFTFSVDDPIRITFDPRLADETALWRFALLDVSPRYMIAIGVKTSDAELSLRATQIVPLRGRTLSR